MMSTELFNSTQLNFPSQVLFGTYHVFLRHAHGVLQVSELLFVGGNDSF